MQIATIFRAHHGCYGSPRIHAELCARGTHISLHRVASLMQKAELRAVRSRRRPRTLLQSTPAAEATGNLLDRNFVADAPNQKWVADATYIPTNQGWLYLAVVLDLFSRKVVGWSSNPRFGQELVCSALEDALATRTPPALHHSDRGVQYRSLRYVTLLKQHAIQSSMSRAGECQDNAVVESFFATLKAEILSVGRTSSPAEVEQALFRYIDGYYNRERRHSALDYESPDTFEQAYRNRQLSHGRQSNNNSNRAIMEGVGPPLA